MDKSLVDKQLENISVSKYWKLIGKLVANKSLKPFPLTEEELKEIELIRLENKLEKYLEGEEEWKNIIH